MPEVVHVVHQHISMLTKLISEMERSRDRDDLLRIVLSLLNATGLCAAEASKELRLMHENVNDEIRNLYQQKKDLYGVSVSDGLSSCGDDASDVGWHLVSEE